MIADALRNGLRRLAAWTTDLGHPRDLALRRWWGGGISTPAGVTVDENSALTYAAVWKAVNVISGAVAKLPCVVYRRDSRGNKERYAEHPGHRLLHRAPNATMGPFQFIKTLQAHCL